MSGSRIENAALLAALIVAAAPAAAQIDVTRAATSAARPSPSLRAGPGTPSVGAAATPSWGAMTPPREAREETALPPGGTLFLGPLVGTRLGQPIGGMANDTPPAGAALQAPALDSRPARPCDASPRCRFAR